MCVTWITKWSEILSNRNLVQLRKYSDFATSWMTDIESQQTQEHFSPPPSPPPPRKQMSTQLSRQRQKLPGLEANDWPLSSTKVIMRWPIPPFPPCVCCFWLTVFVMFLWNTTWREKSVNQEIRNYFRCRIVEFQAFAVVRCIKITFFWVITRRLLKIENSFLYLKTGQTASPETLDCNFQS